MAKGLPWVRISTEIAMDGEIELVSDAAFRTYVEIIALSGHYLLDGCVPLRLVRKQCNAADIDGALRELSSGEHPYLMIDDGNVVIPKYDKWQETADQVGKRREATLQRVRKHRAAGDDRDGVTETDTDDSGNGITSVQSTELRVESREEEKTILSDETPDRPTQKCSHTALIRARFEHWKATFPEETLRMSLTDDRKRAISGRLREGIAPETIDQAVTNARTDPWWNGAQDGEWKADIKTLCGKGSTVENLAARSRKGKTNLDRIRAQYGGEP